jgi:hypothetical protein
MPAKSRRSAGHTAVKTPIASRADLQFMSAFVIGSIAPFVGGFIASVVSALLWNIITSDYFNQIGILVNCAIMAVFVLGYLGCFGLYTYLMVRWLSAKLSFLSATRALLPVALSAVLSITISYGLASINPNLSPNAAVISDAVSIVIFGSGYVLGWWLVRRYAKL